MVRQGLDARPCSHEQNCQGISGNLRARFLLALHTANPGEVQLGGQGEGPPLPMLSLKSSANRGKGQIHSWIRSSIAVPAQQLDAKASMPRNCSDLVFNGCNGAGGNMPVAIVYRLRHLV